MPGPRTERADLGVAAFYRAVNARQMVLLRDPRFADLSALVSQMASQLSGMSGQMTTMLGQVGTMSGQLGDLAADLATNDQNDKVLAQQIADGAHATQQQTAQMQAQFADLQGQIDGVSNALDTTAAQLTAADDALAARITTVEAGLTNEATVRAAADKAEAAARAQADATEARARADADTSNATLAAQATALEATARQQADAAEQAARAAADVSLAARVAVLESDTPAVTSGRASAAAVTLGVGATVAIPVVFDAPAPDANYTPVVVLDATLLANVAPAGFTNKTAAGVTVTVKAKAALTLATLNVTVIALKL